MRAFSTNRRGGRFSRAALAAALVVAVASACTPDEAEDTGVSGEPARGGTVRVLTQIGGFDTLDPQRLFVTSQLNASKLITRTLTTFAAAPGVAGSELVGDLATDTGRPNKDFTVWEFTLRQGIKWENGETVTCEDVRYGVLRNFDIRNADDAVIVSGPPYPVKWLDVPQDYTGSLTEPETHVPGAVCIDDRTIRFKLTESIPHFPAGVAMPAFSPVPAGSDTGADYVPVATGPYKLAEFQPLTSDSVGVAVFERNDQWDAETDPVRSASPDRVEFEFGVDLEHAAQQIITGNPDYDNAVMYENVPANYIQQVINDAQLMSQTVTGSTSSITYMAINTETVTDVECRQALVYGFNKRKYLDIRGGQIFGEYASSMIAPDDPAHKDFDIYGLNGSPEGDLNRAQQLLDEAGDCPTTLTLDAPDTPANKLTAQTVVDTYGRLGISVKVNLIDPGVYYSELDFEKNQHDLVISGWAPDWPGGSGVLPALYHGDLLVEGSNSNYSRLDDPEINTLMDEAAAAGDLAESNRLWGEVDEAVHALAASVPISYMKAVSLCGPKVRGAFLNSQWGAVDISSLGVVGDTE
ncbi:peptide/nickel transport system substrate-binding protein [Stackebrandtia endophytica]|uniref:Peptide/nickel transport system substrate-binding protein n=1 Tax=Stackebrandtia endophytica TaxID=1496996 RepID=A0A543B494_9ACTN|nr:ABC transporter substrate-binding protein [Stackebrandtia endophytica]TQL79647.1 peptide/nickel transport system substrate-binding protein [Stackebrandtia endophytica]